MVSRGGLEPPISPIAGASQGDRCAVRLPISPPALYSSLVGAVGPHEVKRELPGPRLRRVDIHLADGRAGEVVAESLLALIADEHLSLL